MYGGYNPYLFAKGEKFLAFQAAIGRYANYVKEWLEVLEDPICIEGCYNPETKDYKLIETRDIYEAMLYGTSKNGELSIIVDGEVFNPNAFVSQKLMEVLSEKSEQQVKALK